MIAQIRNIEKYFATPLGVIRCGFLCSEVIGFVETRKYENGNSEIFKTKGHRIEIISFKIRVPLYNGDDLTDSFGWIFRVEKILDVEERIELHCLLDKKDDSVIFDAATGENLDSIQADDNEWTLNIGTEDGEVLSSRAEMNDWFPIRLKNKVGFYQSITEMRQNGLVTSVPDLWQGEKMHIQYLTAYDRKDDQKVNTWLAVEEFKRKLENWIGIW